MCTSPVDTSLVGASRTGSGCGIVCDWSSKANFTPAGIAGCGKSGAGSYAVHFDKFVPPMVAVIALIEHMVRKGIPHRYKP